MLLRKRFNQRLTKHQPTISHTRKVWIANALARQACRNRYRTLYIRMPGLTEQRETANLKPGSPAELIRKISGYRFLVLDEWLIDKPNTSMSRFIHEIMERREDTASTIFCTQYRQKDWPGRFDRSPRTDAILDRIVHNSTWIETGGYNMRARTHHQ